jgi:hypothetical protein
MFRGEPRQSISAAPRTDAAGDADHDERIEGEAVAIVHAPDVHFSFYGRQVQSSEDPRAPLTNRSDDFTITGGAGVQRAYGDAVIGPMHCSGAGAGSQKL